MLVRVGTEPRARSHSERSPGPGSYDTINSRASSPGWRFIIHYLISNNRIGRSKRVGLHSGEKTPGPGTYQMKGRIGEAPKYAMRLKTFVVSHERFPGPGEYTPLAHNLKTRPPSAVIGRGKRYYESFRHSPGPAAYNHRNAVISSAKKASPSYTFGVSRTHLKVQIVPGPGSYKIPCSFAALPRYSVIPGSVGFGSV